MTTQDKIIQFTNNLQKLLLEKNKRYGDSALNPLAIFNKTGTINSIEQRLDDKLSRIKNSTQLRKNDIIDLLGYGVLLCIANDWIELNDLID